MDIKARMEKMVEEAIVASYVHQGEEKGYATGLFQGTVMALQWASCELVEHRFKCLPNVQRHYIWYVKDEDRLKAAFRQALSLENLEDLRI